MHTPIVPIRSRRGAGRRPSAGFTLIEGLIAMLVMAFGILALVVLQNAFRVSADDSKLRAEATRLAQQKLDELRAFEQVAADPARVDYVADVVASATPETINPGAFSNTTFSRSWTVTPRDGSATVPTHAASLFKTVTVTVAWTDRRGAQQLSMSTVIGRADPGSISTLGVGPGSTVVRRPKDRNIDIPYPAVKLDGGELSAFQPPGSGALIVFDNTTGEVVGMCSAAALPAEGGTVNLGASGCNSTRGLLLSGYVRFCSTNNCGTTNQPGDAGAVFANASDPTLALDGTAPLVLDVSNQAGGTPTITCWSRRQVTLNSGQTVDDTGQANNQLTARFVSYACVAYPVDHDGNTATPKRWWGRATLNPSGWTIGSSGGQYKVCRFTSDLNQNGAISNNEHPLWYRGVTKALTNQNFLVRPQNENCPTDKPSDPVNGDFVSANTATHQTSGSLVTGAELSFTCATIACNGANKSVLEPADSSLDLATESAL